MKQWISSLAIALAFVAALGVTSAPAQVIVIEEDETVAPATMPRVLMEPQPGAVVVQPEPSAVVVQPAAPVVASRPVRKLAPVTAAQVNEDNAHQIVSALAEELDREEVEAAQPELEPAPHGTKQ